MRKDKRLVIIGRDIDGGTGMFISQMGKLKTVAYEKTAIIINKPKFRTNKIYGFSKVIVLTKRTGVDYISFLSLSLVSVFSDFKALRKELVRMQPDIILSVGLYSNILSALIKAFSIPKTILILTNHNSLEFVMKRKLSQPLRWCIRKIMTRIFDQAASIIFVSKGLKDEFLLSFSTKSNIAVIPYGLNLPEVNRLSKVPIPDNELSFFSSKPIILSIGRLDEQKDFLTLIKACSLLNKYINFRLLIIGDGKLRTALQKLIDDLSLNDSVFLLGWKKNVFPYIKNADIFVLSSNYEGFGYVLLEAMSLRIPVISTDVPCGPHEIIGNNMYGLLSKPHNIPDMAQQLKKLITNRKKLIYYSKKSLERSRNFQEKDMLKEYALLISKVEKRLLS